VVSHRGREHVAGALLVEESLANRVGIEIRRQQQRGVAALSKDPPRKSGGDQRIGLEGRALCHG